MHVHAHRGKSKSSRAAASAHPADYSSHSLAHEPGATVLAGSLAFTVLLVVIEFLGGILGRSIALLSDAVHNLSDIPSLAISWLGLRWTQRPADEQRTYGYHRAGILAAFTNAILLLLIAIFLFYESWQRFEHPQSINAQLMIGISLAALAVNGGITLAVARGRRDLNIRSVFIHNLGDALSNVAILIGAIAIRETGITWVDPLLGAAIGVLVLWSSIGVLRESAHILLEGLPRDMELERVARTMLEVPGVQEVHDIHVWTLGTDWHALSCHVCIPDMHMQESENLRQEIQRRLEQEFNITHSTIQFERAGLPRDARFYMPEPLP
jgi:cobalt-zinc-cadmium efflux system protein